VDSVLSAADESVRAEQCRRQRHQRQLSGVFDEPIRHSAGAERHERGATGGYGRQEAASYDSSGVSPGEIVAVFGQSLGPTTVANLALNSDGLLSTSIGGVEVLFNGYPAPLIYALDSQLAAIVPYEVSQFQTLNVAVIYNGNASVPLAVPVSAPIPAIFTDDVSRNSASNPGARGQYVAICGTGEGVTTPPGSVSV
jgi:uncharacterized protein (TIGR03437 family)